MGKEWSWRSNMVPLKNISVSYTDLDDLYSLSAVFTQLIDGQNDFLAIAPLCYASGTKVRHFSFSILGYSDQDISIHHRELWVK